MQFLNTASFFIALVALTFPLSIAYAGNIVSGSSTARFDATDSLINFGTVAGDVTVTDGGITGYAWSEDYGWINLSPTTAGVLNDGEGNLSGYAWGETLGWINFAPTLGGVSIDEGGFFSGYAWAENGGWIVFSCETDASCGTLDHRVQTTWKQSSGGGSGGSGGGFGGVGESGSEDGEETGEEAIPPLPEPEPTPTPEEITSPQDETIGDDDEEKSGDSEEVIRVNEEEGTASEEGDSRDESSSENADSKERGRRGIVRSAALTITRSVSLVTRAISEGLGNISGASKVLLEEPAREVSVKTVSAVAVSAGVIATGVTLFAAPVSLTEIIFIPARLLSLIFAFLGYKKKRYPWGTVYDSVTKQPLDPAYVKLIARTSEGMTGSLTDLDGRYGFHVEPGTYVLEAGKTHYEFPSKRLMGKEADVMYGKLYFGEEVAVDDVNSVIMRNIPLDPVGFDWNEYIKKQQRLTKFYSRFDVLIYTVLSLFFYSGFVLSLVLLIAEPTIISGLVILLYIIVGFARRLTPSPARLGKIRDERTGDPLPFAIIRVILHNVNQEVRRVVADKYGRYYCLVTPGTYRVEIDEKVGADQYENVHVSAPFESTKGIISRSFKI